MRAHQCVGWLVISCVKRELKVSQELCVSVGEKARKEVVSIGGKELLISCVRGSGRVHQESMSTLGS